MDRTFYGNRTFDASQPPDAERNPVFNAPPETPPVIAPAAPAEELSPQQVIGEKEIAEAQKILTKYKDSKANLESRIVEDELWWELRHWEAIGRGKEKDKDPRPKPTSGWLFNTITNKHADAMDNIPEPVVLPREKTDEMSSKALSSILPVIMEQTHFEDVYDDCWWEKLKHGTAIYGVFWNSDLENGLGQIDIKPIDILKVFWEPGIQDIQDSRNLFIVEMMDQDLAEQQYPQLKGKKQGDVINIKEYIYDDQVPTEDKVLIVDWYYKVRNEAGVTVLHYCKFCGDEVLYATENDPGMAETGLYDHGKYPVVFDCMFPEKGTPAGFGYVAIDRDPQMYIDMLSSNILESSMMGTKKRFFVSNSTGINEAEFLDWTNPLVHVEGEIGEERIREITVNPIAPIYQQTMELKIDEMKETSANRDVNNGGGGSVTAAASIAALQESGNKVSRDTLSKSYRNYAKIVELCIELIRQFYDEARSFRITGEVPGQYNYVDFRNTEISDQPMPDPATGETLYRKPIFDLKIKAQKKSPFSRMELNERAKELYGLGFFNPDNAQSALGALEMMDFEGIEKVKEFVQKGQTLMSMLQQANALIQQQQMTIAGLTGQTLPSVSLPASQQESGRGNQNPKESSKGSDSGSSSPGSQVMKANTPMTSYGDRLAQRSKPDMSAGSAKDLVTK